MTSVARSVDPRPRTTACTSGRRRAAAAGKRRWANRSHPAAVGRRASDPATGTRCPSRCAARRRDARKGFPVVRVPRRRRTGPNASREVRLWRRRRRPPPLPRRNLRPSFRGWRRSVGPVAAAAGAARTTVAGVPGGSTRRRTRAGPGRAVPA